jgi:hypothetical protein
LDLAMRLLDEAGDGQVALPQRPSLNKILKELERHGLIAVRYAAIDIRDPQRLDTRAG